MNIDFDDIAAALLVLMGSASALGMFAVVIVGAA